MLGRDLEVAAHVVRDQFLDILRRSHRQVVAQARANQDFLDALDRARLAVQLDQRPMIGGEVLANPRGFARTSPPIMGR